MSIIQRVEVQESGADAGARNVRGLNSELNETERAGNRAGAGLRTVERGAQGASAAGGGLRSTFAGINSTVKSAGDQFKKATDGVEAIAGSFGRITGTIGIVSLAFSGLETVVGFVRGLLDDTSDSTRNLTKEFVEQRTGIDDLSDGLDTYARLLGQANAKGLTMLEQQRELRNVLNGGGVQTVASVRAQLRKLDEEIAAGPGLSLAGAFGGRDPVADFKDKLDLRERLRKMEEQLLVREGVRTDTGNVVGNDLEELDRIRRERQQRNGGGGGRARDVGPGRVSAPGNAYASEPGEFQTDPRMFGAFRSASFREFAGQTSGPGRAGTGIAGAIEAAVRPEPFAAATAAIKAFREARDAAFDAERATQFFDIVNSSVDQFGKGITASAANAALFGTSFKKGANEAMKAIASQAVVQAAWEGAQAVGALALGRPEAAMLHWEAAGLYAGVAALAVLGASATGGLRSGRSAGSRGASSTAPEVGPDRGGSTIFAPQIYVGLDGESIYRKVYRISVDREASRGQPRLAVAA